MSIQTEINRIESAKTAIATAIAGKGVTVTSGTKLDGMPALIEGIKTGGGGGSVETCTVTLKASTIAYRPYMYCYTYMDSSGNITSRVDTPTASTSITLENVVCGSVVCVEWLRTTMVSMERAIITTNAELMMYATALTAIHITAPAGGYASVTYNPVDDGPA